MTAAAFVVVALLALPIVLLFATAGCGLDPLGNPGPVDEPATPQDPGSKPDPDDGVLIPFPGTPTPYAELVLGRVGLVGYWRLGESGTVLNAPNPTAVNAHSPGTLNGRYINPASITLDVGGALPKQMDTAALFSGTGGYVEVAQDVWLTPPSLTVEFFMRVDATLLVWQVMVGCYEPQLFNDGVIDRGYRVRARTILVGGDVGKVEIQAHLGGMTAALEPTSPLAQSVWHHVALSYDKSMASARLLVDGVLAAHSDGTYDITLGTGKPLRFAADQQPLLTTFNGLLDEVALYSDGLSDDVIGQHYAAAGA